MAGTSKILIIDDDQEVISSIATPLQEKGFDVISAVGFQNGLDKAQEEMPDLVYLSLLLQGSNGLKASKAIHSIEGLEKVPVIMMISYEGELDPRYTVTIGIVDVIVKPLDPGMVLAKVENILGAAEVSALTEETEGEPVIEEAEALSPQEETASYDEEVAVEAEALDDATLLSQEAVAIDDEAELSDELEPAEMAEEPVVQPEEEAFKDDVLEFEEEQDFPGITEFSSDTASEDSMERDGPSELQPADEPALLDDDFETLSPEEAFPDDSTAEEISIDEEIDAPDPSFEKDSFTEEEPISTDEDLPPQEDAFDQLRSSNDDKDALDLEQFGFDDSDQGKEKNKMPLLIGAVAVVIIGLGAGAFLTKKIFFGDSDTPSSAPVEESRVTEEGVPDETIKEVLPLDEGPVQKIIPEKRPDTVEKKVQPPVTVQKPVRSQPAPTIKKEVSAKKGRYSVQVGAFGNEKNAAALVSKLKNKGYNAFMQKHMTAGKKTIYRVFAGTFNDNKKALELSRTILEKEGIKSFVHRN
jgi:DNA-binding response OmpR family regulator